MTEAEGAHEVPPDGDEAVALIDAVRAYFEDLMQVGIDAVPAVSRRAEKASPVQDEARGRGGWRGGPRVSPQKPSGQGRHRAVASADRFGPAEAPDLTELLGGSSEGEAAGGTRTGGLEAGPPRGTSKRSLSEAIAACQACPRARGRARVVLGMGNPHAVLMLVGDAPSEADEAAGKPFQGPVGALLDRMLENVLKLKRNEVYLTNAVKCRGDSNQPVLEEEFRACSTFLEQEIARVKPRVVVALGNAVARQLLATGAPLHELRGLTFSPLHGGDYKIRVMHHPAEMVGDVTEATAKIKRETNADLKLLRRLLDRIAGSAEGKPSESSKE